MRGKRRLVRDVIKGQTILTMPPDTKVRAAAERMRERGVGSAMVVEDGRLAGIFTERDGLFRVLAAGLDPDATPISAVMTADVTTVPGSTPLLHALHVMHEGGFRHVPVVEDGHPVGMVSIRDALGEELDRFHDEVARKEAISEVVAY